VKSFHVAPVVPPVDPVVGSPVVVPASVTDVVETSVVPVGSLLVVEAVGSVALVVVGLVGSVALVVSPVAGAVVVPGSVDVGVVAEASVTVVPTSSALASYASVFGDMSSPS
jgi:hypothetical protein